MSTGSKAPPLEPERHKLKSLGHLKSLGQKPETQAATDVALAGLQTQVQEDSEPRSAQRRCGPESFGSTDERASCIEDASDGTLTWHREGASCYSRLADIRCAL